MLKISLKHTIENSNEYEVRNMNEKTDGNYIKIVIPEKKRLVKLNID